MSTTTRRRRLLRAALTAVSAISVSTLWPLAEPAPAQADWECTDWAFKGPFSLRQENGAVVSFTLHGQKFPLEGIPARNGNVNGNARGGNDQGIKDGIEGGNVGFQIFWDDKSYGNYVGYVDDIGMAHGTTYNKQGGRGSDVGWDALTQLQCLTPPPDDPVLVPERVINPGDPDSPFGNPGGAPKPEEAPPAPPSEIKVSWQPWQGGITATVSITNNANKPAVPCRYQAEGDIERPFTVSGDAPAPVVISPAFPQNRYWPVTVTCDNGLSVKTGTTY